MNPIVSGSLAARILLPVRGWFTGQWSSSRIVNRFLSQSPDACLTGAGALRRGSDKILARLQAFCERLRLTRLFKNSIFAMPFLWCALAAAVAPFLPTTGLIGLTGLCFLTFFIRLIVFNDLPRSRSPVNTYIYMYALVYVISIFTSVSFSGSLKGGMTTALFILFSMIISKSIGSKKQLLGTIYVFVLGGTIVALYGLYQYVFGAAGPSWVDPEMFSEISIRVYSTLGNPNVLAEYLILVIPFAFACLLHEKNPYLKFIFLGAFGITILCMVFTFARGSWLALLASAAIFLILLDRRYILLGIAGLIILYFTLPDVILSRFTSIGNLGDSSSSYRMSIWLGSIAMLKDYWFTGIGPGTDAFNRIYPLYSFNTAAAQHSHNLFLQLVCDSGISGLLVFVAMVFSFLRSLCVSFSRVKDKRKRYFHYAAISSVFGFLVNGITEYSFYNYRVTFVFWAVMGLGIAIARLLGPEGEAND